MIQVSLDTIVSENGNLYRVRDSENHVKLDSYTGNLLEIETDTNMKIKIGSEHDFLFLKENLKLENTKSKNLKNNDYLVLHLDNLNTESETNLNYNNLEKTSRSKNFLVPDKTSLDLLGLLGLIYGDGCFGKRNIPFISLKEDEKVKKYFLDKTKNLFGFAAYSDSEKDEKTETMGIASILVKCFLVYALGYDVSNLTKKDIVLLSSKTIKENADITKFIGKSSRKSISEFIKGLFEADGDVNICNRAIRFTQNNENFIRDTQQILFNLGLVFILNKRKTPEKFSVSKLGKNIIQTKPVFGIKSTSFSIEKFKNEIGFISDRKQILLKNICEESLHLKKDFEHGIFGNEFDAIPYVGKHIRKLYLKLRKNGVENLPHILYRSPKKVKLSYVNTIIRLCKQNELHTELDWLNEHMFFVKIKNIKEIPNEPVYTLKENTEKLKIYNSLLSD